MTRFSLTCTALTFVLLSYASSQSAQPLAELAPAETVLTLGYKTSGEFNSNALQEDLAALDWAGASETLEKLAEAGDLGSDLTGDALLNFLGEFLEGLNTQGEGQALLEDLCPELLDERFSEMQNSAADALLTVSVSPFNPVPAGTALLRVDEEVAELYADMQQVIITCAERSGEVVRLEQGDVTLYVIGDGGDFPVIIGRLDTLFFAGSNPEVLRGVVRRAQGSSEANFAGGRLYTQTSNILEADGVSFSLNLAGLAEIAQNFGGLFVDGPEMEAAFERGLAILRTLEGYAGSVRATPEGLESESLTVVNPDGGDVALAELLLCETCTVSLPFLAPETSEGVNAQYVALEPAFNYLQGVLNDLEPLVGESLDIRAILREELDFDIDTALFGWLGNDFYTLTLEPFSADLGTLFYGQEQAFYVPVASQEEAEAGLVELSKLWALVLEASSDAELSDFSPQVFSEVATETSTYKDVEITRYRSGVNTDLGVAFVGNYLVVSSPAAALRDLIDVFDGATPNILSSRSYQSATSNFPENIAASSYLEYGTQLAGVADLLGLFSQPLAFAANVGLEETGGTNAQNPSYAELLNLTDILPDALGIIAERVGAASGYGEVREGTIYRRSTLQIDW